MKHWRFFLWATFVVVAAGCGDGDRGVGPTSVSAGPTMRFFVTSTKSVTGDLGGLRSADIMCHNLAAAVGAAHEDWRAYLSVEHDPDNRNKPTNARDRIGNGPWFNANGVMVARDLADLHARPGEAAVFVDERGQPIPGNWPASPRPVEHDILTGSARDGTLMTGFTCGDWTSAAENMAAQVGHSDGLGGGGDTSGSLSFWNSAHVNQSCANTAPRGGAGRIYCFAR